MSYIQIEIDGKLRGLKFNQLSIEIYAKNIDADAIETSSVYATFYAGLRGNSYAKKEEADYTFENVVDWVDGLYNAGKKDTIIEVSNCFAETQAFKDFLERLQKQVEEVKAPQKKKK